MQSSFLIVKNGSRPSYVLLTACTALLATAAVVAQAEAQEAPPGKAAPAPKLEVSTSEWDFGLKWAGEPAETAITLRNAGDAPLHIERVKTSCGCTAARLDNKVLQPGETRDVTVSYNTHKRGENVSQRVQVYSDDPQQPVTTILVKGRVRQLAKTDPVQGLHFGVLGRDEVATRSVEITCEYDKPLKLRLGDFSSEHFGVRLEETEEGKRYRLSATTKPPLPDGYLRAEVPLLTDMERVPEIPVRILGSVQAPVAVAPRLLYVYEQMQKPTQRTLRVSTRREKPVKITGVTATDPAIKSEILPAGGPSSPDSAASGVTLIRLTLPPADEFPAGGATITITTDDEEYPELTVAVRKQAAARTARGAAEKVRVTPRPRATDRPQQQAP